MNKDVISITPEDDITDVIAQIKASEKKIVAIIPPEPAGILRSAVNIKLIAKVSEEAEKVPVFITSDPAILKLAHEIRIPVSEDLNSRPRVPTEKDLGSASVESKGHSKIAEDFVAPIESEDEDDEDEEDDKEEKKENKKSDKKSKKDKKEKKQSRLAKKFPWIAGKEKIIVVVAIVILLIIGFFVWALVIAPFVDIYIKVSVNNENNFSQSVTFTEDENAEDIAAGKFYLQTATKEFKQRMNFTATGKKDVGEKASGEISVALFVSMDEIEDYIDDDDEESHKTLTVKIPSGTKFALGDLGYVSAKEVIYSFESSDGDIMCENGDTYKTLKRDGCQLTEKIPIVSAEPGDKYNVDDEKHTWTTSFASNIDIVEVDIYNTGKIAGGTSKVVTTVLQSDVDKVKESLSAISETDGKTELYESISDSNIILESTFKSADPVFEVSPAVGEEVGEGKTPTVTATREFSVNTIDVAQVEEFIKDNIKLQDDQKIYSYGDKYIEYFSKTEDGYAGKLKTTYKTGPNISEEIIYDKIAGRKVGDAQSIIRSIQGIDSYDVKIDTSVLLNTIPTEKERVKITIDFGK